ncbi:anti-sigma factor [Ammoniphilus sp. CFH 90114]|uniref:anti-sigma factor family protein n=1 Tax=Ammoniphilus sp. CFH 90114 TaxID=2493665 RepID=UPI00100E5B94|nr:zf-HC2 domain-containing protein [Ammoniphilus sp. CFH 90114]RXT13925.1 zf-HC2 domain-containing protein [Ammoniphilus sp. CFH 90114]
MRCSDAFHFMAGYVDQTLPEHSMKAMKQHLGQCQDCQMEYIIWKESSELFQMEFSTLPVLEGAPSMSEGVMARLAREDKWKFPITAHVFAISPAMKRWLTTLSILFLLVFGVLMYGTLNIEHVAKVEPGQVEWKELSSAHMVIAIDQLVASSEEKSSDMRYRLMASIGDPLQLDHSSYTPPNIGLVAGFLGIMVTVVTMSWLSRA